MMTTRREAYKAQLDLMEAFYLNINLIDSLSRINWEKEDKLDATWYAFIQLRMWNIFALEFED